ncbi:MAG: Lpp/OprI family alanine-zipper lipoprotein [Nitrosomonas sp.]|nr:Lpp/OprI family alanine-zipper lipoprotein [Nitrosomonas sp.]MDP1950350.1 Lpp/OprI family alanine-zipper lipoprotein [Nitrosomonas sp.]
MNEKIKRQLRILTLAASVGVFAGLSGCATTGQVEGLQTQIDAVASEAASAKAEAAAANAKANEAINIANEANRRSIDTETKVNRAFDKAMHKR